MYKAISVFVTLAFASFASATPLGASDVTGLVGSSKGLALPAAAPALPAVARAVDVPAVPEVDASSLKAVELPGKRDSSPDLVVILTDVTEKLGPILDELKATVTVTADVDVTHVVALLSKVIIVLEGAVKDVKAVVAGTVVVAVHEVATVLKIVLILVATILNVVVGVPALATATVLGHVETIKTLLGEVLKLVLALVPGLLAALVNIIGDLVNLLVHLNIVTVLSLLGL